MCGSDVAPVGPEINEEKIQVYCSSSPPFCHPRTCSDGELGQFSHLKASHREQMEDLQVTEP